MPKPRTYVVHAFLAVRVPVKVEATSEGDALARVRSTLQPETAFRDSAAEYAGEITDYVVDKLDPRGREVVSTRSYDSNGNESTE